MAEGNTTLALDYSSMCNNACKCGGELGYCMAKNKNKYKRNQCESACVAWFPGDVTLAGACKNACAINDDNVRPRSQADYLGRFVTDQQILAKYGYDFDPTTGVGSQLLNKQKNELLLGKIFNLLLVVAALVAVYFLLTKFLLPKANVTA